MSKIVGLVLDWITLLLAVLDSFTAVSKALLNATLISLGLWVIMSRPSYHYSHLWYWLINDQVYNLYYCCLSKKIPIAYRYVKKDHRNSIQLAKNNINLGRLIIVGLSHQEPVNHLGQNAIIQVFSIMDRPAVSMIYAYSTDQKLPVLLVL